MGKSIDKNINKNLIRKYSQKLLDHAKQSAIDALKATSKRTNKNTAEATGGFIDTKIAAKITKVSKASPQDNSETARNEEQIPTERYISPEERQKNI